MGAIYTLNTAMGKGLVNRAKMSVKNQVSKHFLDT